MFFPLDKELCQKQNETWTSFTSASSTPFHRQGTGVYKWEYQAFFKTQNLMGEINARPWSLALSQVVFLYIAMSIILHRWFSLVKWPTSSLYYWNSLCLACDPTFPFVFASNHEWDFWAQVNILVGQKIMHQRKNWTIAPHIIKYLLCKWCCHFNSHVIILAI